VALAVLEGPEHAVLRLQLAGRKKSRKACDRCILTRTELFLRVWQAAHVARQANPSHLRAQAMLG
jgi:hypothetical protein